MSSKIEPFHRKNTETHAKNIKNMKWIYLISNNQKTTRIEQHHTLHNIW